MLGFLVFIIVIIVLVLLFRLQRRREIDSFKDANFADFVEFDGEQSSSVADPDEASEIAVNALAASARAIEQRETRADSKDHAEAALYQKRDAIFDEVTRAFLLTLYEVLANNFQVLVHVPVAALVRNRRAEKGPVAAPGEEIDFVICRKTDLAVVCGIQLHTSAGDRIAEILKQVDIPLVNLKVGVDYSSDELAEELEGVLPANTRVHLCRRCNNPMVVRLARSGKQKGKYFWVCNQCKLTATVH